MVSNRGTARGDPEVAPADMSSGAASSPEASDDDAMAMDEGGIQDQGFALNEDGSPATAPSTESSDSDIIHIDLTQRPPPLPVSGLALEQIVSMLPGNTYAISGSGIPMRTSPRPDPRQRSPSAGGAKTPESAAANGSPRQEPGAGTEAAAGSATQQQGESASADQRGSGGGASSGTSGPSHVTLTYIPGLGLVPVVIHEGMASDEDQLTEEDVVVGVREGPAAGEALEHAEDNSGRDSSSAPQTISEDSDIDNDIMASDAVEPCEVLNVHAADSAKQPESRGNVIPAETDSSDSPPEACDSPYDGTAGRYNISEAQLQGIMEQAVHGLVFANAVYEESTSETDEQDSQLEYRPPRGLAIWRKYACIKVVPEEPVGASADSPEQVADVLTSTLQASIDAEDSEAQSQDRASSGAAHVHSEDTGCEDDLDEVNSGIVDELDDSGGGGCEIDGPESMLGGLAASRLGHGANGVVAGGPDGYVAMFPTPVTSSVFGGAQAPTRRATAEAAVPQPGAAIFSVLGAHVNCVSSGTFPPRARYMSHSTARTQDAAARGGESNPLSGSSNTGPEPGGDTALAPAKPAAASSAAAISASSDAPLLSAGAPLKPHLGGSSMPTPFAGGLLGASSAGSGSNLNSTLRMSGQSLSAIRQAAFRAEGQHQAKLMEERLGGSADIGVKAHTTGRNRQAGHQASPVNLVNPFSCADHEASAAAGLTEITHEPIQSGPHRVGRRGATSGSVFHAGYASGDTQKRTRPQTTRGEDSGDLEDILRNRPIIQPRYPTDPKPKDCSDSEQHEHESTSEDATAERPPVRGAGEEGTGAGLRPRHRRSVDLVDLDLLAANEAAMQGAGMEDSSPSGSAEAQISGAVPNVRSLKAMRKSNDGQLPPPMATKSPRLHEDADAVSSSSGSSTAHSVADERLVDELEALREELGQKTTLVAGLRGELRKYTDLTMRLEHQLNELRAQAADRTAVKPAARPGNHSDAGLGDQKASGNATAAPSQAESDGSCRPQQTPDIDSAKLEDKSSPTPVPSAPLATQPSNTPAPAAGAIAQPGVTHTLPPHPQAQGLEAPARLVLYQEILSKAQIHVGRSAGPAPPDLRDAQDLLQGKEQLDAGMEKVMLIKLQKLVSWGCEAAWKASTAQQQLRYMEQVVQQAAQARVAVEAERDQFKRALEEAMGSKAQPRRQSHEEEDEDSSDLRRQLGAAQGEAAEARAQASAVASLNADVRKLRGQLRGTRDASAEQHSTGAAATGAAARADAMAWNMERQMLLKTINALEQELTQARVAADAEQGEAPPEVPVESEEAAREVAMAEAAMARLQQLQAEKDAMTAECTELRHQLSEVMEAAAATTASSTRDMSDLQAALERAQQELQTVASAREEVQQAAVAATHQDEDCVLLRTQVVELRRELALTAAAEAAADARQDEVEDELAEAKRSVAAKDALIEELQQQLLAIGVEVQESRVEVEAARTAAHTEAQLKRESSHKIEALEEEFQLQVKAAAASIEDLEQALQSTIQERDSIQQVLETKESEVEVTKAELDDVRSTVLQLQVEASTAHSQVAELQEVLSTLKKERDEAEAKAAEAETLAAAAQNRASDAEASSSLAKSALSEMVEEVEVLRGHGSVLEAEIAVARAQVGEERLRAESAEAALAAAREELHELRVAVARLEVEGRDLRTALSAEDDLQLHLRGQVECLESELAQACGLAQSQGGAPVAEVQTEGEEGEGGEREETADSAHVEELKERVLVLQQQLAEAMQLCDAATGQVAELQEQLAESVGQRVLVERTLEDTTAQLEAAQLRLKARNSIAGGAAGASPREKRQVHEAAAAANEIDVLLAEKVLLMENCARLQAEVERLQAAGVDAEADASGDVAAKVASLQEELVTAQSELKRVRSDLGAAKVELAMKGELLAAKDRSLANLQESVDALKVALQAAQQRTQVPSPSKSPGPEVAAAGLGETAEANIARYHDTVAALQSKFADSESTIRRLEQQVAALETRISSEETPSPKPSVKAEVDVRPKDGQASDTVRSHTPTGTPPQPRFSSVGGALGTPNVHELQLQIMQWRALGEDLHARYLSKKETLRRLREQLAAEQWRHVDERGRWNVQLEAAQQRLARMAADLGTALRRCIVLDLQPLSTTSLTTSPRTQLGGSDVAEDVNTLATLLGRQATALIESLEAALDQVASAREDRALLSAQLAHRQAVFDELRHHLTRRDSREGEVAHEVSMANTLSCPSTMPYSSWAGASLQQGSYNTPPKAGQPATNPQPHSDGAHTSTAATGLHRSSPAAGTTPTARGLSPFKSLQAATLNLAQDMAALSAQQAGLRQTLHAVEQRQSPYSKPRALSYSAVGSCSGGGSPNAAMPPTYPTGLSPRVSPRPTQGQSADSTGTMHGRSGAGLHPLPTDANSTKHSPRMGHGLYQSPSSTHGVYESGMAQSAGPSRVKASRSLGTPAAASSGNSRSPRSAGVADSPGATGSAAATLTNERRAKLAGSGYI